MSVADPPVALSVIRTLTGASELIDFDRGFPSRYLLAAQGGRVAERFAKRAGSLFAVAPVERFELEVENREPWVDVRIGPDVDSWRDEPLPTAFRKLPRRRVSRAVGTPASRPVRFEGSISRTLVSDLSVDRCVRTLALPALRSGAKLTGTHPRGPRERPRRTANKRAERPR